jgi:hypothetical protein
MSRIDKPRAFSKVLSADETENLLRRDRELLQEASQKKKKSDITKRSLPKKLLRRQENAGLQKPVFKRHASDLPLADLKIRKKKKILQYPQASVVDDEVDTDADTIKLLDDQLDAIHRRRNSLDSSTESVSSVEEEASQSVSVSTIASDDESEDTFTREVTELYHKRV